MPERRVLVVDPPVAEVAVDPGAEGVDRLVEGRALAGDGGLAARPEGEQERRAGALLAER